MDASRLDYEWRVIRGHSPYRWSIVVISPPDPTFLFLPYKSTRLSCSLDRSTPSIRPLSTAVKTTSNYDINLGLYQIVWLTCEFKIALLIHMRLRGVVRPICDDKQPHATRINSLPPDISSIRIPLNALSEPMRAQNSSLRLAKTSKEPEGFLMRYWQRLTTNFTKH